MSDKQLTLEEKIAAALALADATSSIIAELIAETEAAVAAADKSAEAEREKALDPLASPDAAKARATMEDAAFSRDRLKTLLPRLQARYHEVQAQEYLTLWRSDYEKLKVKRDGLAEELRTIYPEFETKITDLFTRIAANDAELSHLHQARPVALRCICLALNLWLVILSALELRNRQSLKSLSCRHLHPASGSPGRRRKYPWPRYTRCPWCRSTTRATAPTGRPRIRKTMSGGQRPRLDGPKKKRRVRRTADAHTRQACGDEVAFRRSHPAVYKGPSCRPGGVSRRAGPPTALVAGAVTAQGPRPRSSFAARRALETLRIAVQMARAREEREDVEVRAVQERHVE